MSVYALWYGGPSYAYPYPQEDMEQFDSLDDAREAFESRYRQGDWMKQDFKYIFKVEDSVFTPTVEDSYMHVWDADGLNPGTMGDYPEPDHIFEQPTDW